jgi:HPt (histidine-containing phosphotransfer) domain-containing protein
MALTTEGSTLVAPRSKSTATLDHTHLTRMTFGDPALAREVLNLFMRQTEALLAELADARPDMAASLAHRMKGSAKGVGAWSVAAAAEMVERAAAADPQALTADVAALRDAIHEANTAIVEFLSAPPIAPGS